MKKWVILTMVIAVGFGAYSWDKRKKAAVTSRTPSRPTTATVESRNIKFVLSAAGDIGPADQVSVRPEINGRIAELPVDIGDTVKKGDLLFSLDDRDLQTERSSRLTEIEGTKLQVQRSQRNYERSKKLFQENLISQELFDDTKTDYDLARNSLERAEKSLRLVEDQLSKTRVVAPFDCTVLTRSISIGQAVSGSGGFNSGTEIMTTANLKDMIINAHVNQTDVTRMKAGQDVNIEVEAVPGLKFTGIVERIAPQATVKNGIKGFAARILLKDIDSRVRPGMTANLTIPLISADNVLAVPLASVFTEQGERYVFVQTGTGFESRTVQLGVADYQFAEIVTGLASGEIVSLVRPSDAEPEKEKRHDQAASKPERKGSTSSGGKAPSTASTVATTSTTTTNSSAGKTAAP